MDTYKIITEPDPLLHQISSEVKEINSEIRHIFDKMLETMYSESGIGLAAVQVGILKKLIVIHLQESEESTPLFLANAKIIAKSDIETSMKEFCLSVPEIGVDIIRPEEVTVEYLDYYGNCQTIEANGLLAKCLQHEIDHTNGIVTIDYIESKLKREMANKKLKKLKNPQK